eukprot:Awhi_evm1s13852
MLSFKHISVTAGMLLALAHGKPSTNKPTLSQQCIAAVNPTPEQCSEEWLGMSNEASAAGFGNFWPPECGPPGPEGNDFIVDTTNICGCGCDGPKCESYTIVLPVAASSESDESLPEDIDLEEMAKNSVGFGVAYAGEMFDGRSWETVGGKTTTASLPSCPN